MATFTDIYKQELKSKGILSSIGGAAFKRTLETVDPRNILFGGKGIVSATGQKIFGKGYSGLSKTPTSSKISDSTSLTSEALSQLLISSKNQEAQLSIIAKNTMNMNAMARDMNVTRQNIMKLVTLNGGKASRGADMFFKNAAAREADYEAKFKKSTAPVPVTEKKTEEKKGGLFGIGTAIISAIVGSLKSIPDIIGKVLTSVFTVDNLSKILGFSGSVLGELGSFLIKVSPFLLRLVPILGAIAGAAWLLKWLSDKNQQANTPEAIDKGIKDYNGSNRAKFATENLNQRDAEDMLKSFKNQREFIGATGYTKEQLQQELELAKKENRPLRQPELRERMARMGDYERAEEAARDSEGSSQGGTAPTSNTTTPQKMAPKDLLSAIARGESAGAGDYNAMNQGTVGTGGRVIGSGNSEKIIKKKLTDMTIGEILGRAAKPGDSAKTREEKGLIFAAGRYQIIPKTLEGLVNAGIADKNEKFSEEVQDRLGMALIEQTGALKLAKKGKFADAQNALAKVWAGIPLATDLNGKKAGESYYAGPGNKAHLKSGADVMASLQAVGGATGTALAAGSSTSTQLKTEMATAPATTVVPVPTATPAKNVMQQTTRIESAYNESSTELFLERVT